MQLSATRWLHPVSVATCRSRPRPLPPPLRWIGDEPAGKRLGNLAQAPGQLPGNDAPRCKRSGRVVAQLRELVGSGSALERGLAGGRPFDLAMPGAPAL